MFMCSCGAAWPEEALTEYVGEFIVRMGRVLECPGCSGDRVMARVVPENYVAELMWSRPAPSGALPDTQ